MALRFRTRLSLTINVLLILTVTAMTLAVGGIFAYDLVRQYTAAGINLQRVSSRNIDFGVRTPERVLDRIEDQMILHGYLVAQLAALAERPQAATPEEISAALRRAVSDAESALGHAPVSEILIAGEEGKPFVSSAPEGGAIRAEGLEEYLPLLRPGAPPILRKAHGGALGESSRSVGMPGVGRPAIIRVSTGEQLVDSIAEEFSIQEFVERFMLPEQYSRLAVIDARGRVVAAVSADGETGEEATGPAMIRACRTFLKNRAMERSIDFFGRDPVVLSRLETESGENPFALFVQYRTKESLTHILDRLIVVGIVGLSMILLGMFVSLFLSRGLSKPIVVLSEGVKEFGRGNLNYRIIWRRRDEFQELSQSINTMAISLQEHMHVLQRETTRRERLESEFRIAEEMQTALLPESPPEVAGLLLAGWSQPSRDVGGDFFDFIDLGEGRVAAVVGDATGKGLPAALLITQCSSVIRTLSHTFHDPGELLFRTNNELYSRISSTHRFVTLAIVVFDVNRGVVTYASAGHPPPLLLHGVSGHAQWLVHAGSFPLGIAEDTEFHKTEFDLNPGDTVVLYSDGLTDAQSPAKESYGEQRIESRAAQRFAAPIDEILTALRQDYEDHLDGKEPFDDTTIVVARYEPAAAEETG